MLWLCQTGLMLKNFNDIGFIQTSGAISKEAEQIIYLDAMETSLPLLIFSVFALGALSLFINNYGIIARIRIPAFICLISIICVMFNERLEQIYEPR